jgi:hypothetical protein
MVNKKYIIWGCSGIGCLTLLVAALMVGSYVLYVAKSFDDLGNPDVRKTWFDNPTKIEDAIGIRLPDFKIKDYKPGEVHFTGDFGDSMIIEFDERIPKSIFDKFEQEAGKIVKSNEEDFYRVCIIVDSVRLHYSNPHIFNHDEYIEINLWRDSLNGVVVYGKW